MLEALGVLPYLKGDMTAITKIAVAIGAENKAIRLVITMAKPKRR